MSPTFRSMLGHVRPLMACLVALAGLLGSPPQEVVAKVLTPTRADTSLLILAAASLSDVLPQVARLWEASGGAPVRFSFDATSRLAPQTLQGSTADLFFSADTRWMDWVEERGGIWPDTRVDLLGNDLVAVVRAGEEGVMPSTSTDLATPAIRRIALAGENVPAGRYGQAALEAADVWEKLEGKVVRAGTVRGALEWVVRGEVDLALVYRTDAMAEGGVLVAFGFPPGAHPPITYPVAVLSTSRLPDVARGFLLFCRSPSGAEVFRAHGFKALAGGSEAQLTVPGLAPSAEGASPGPDLARSFGPDAVPLPDPWSAVRLSLLVALGATLVGLLPALWVGWVLARKDFLGKSVVATLLLVPLVLPPVVTGFLLLSALGSGSPLGACLSRMGAPVPFTLLGATIAALVVGFPLYVVSVRNAFQTVDPRYEEVSWTLGRHPWPTFLRITLPLALPGIAAGAVLSFARGLGEFGATVVLAGNIEGSTRTIALAVYALLESPHGRDAIWVLVGASVLLSLLALLGYEVLSRRQRSQMEGRHGW